jgi:hypothetical protein
MEKYFFKYMRGFYKYHGPPLSGNYYFYDWLKHEYRTHTFRFFQQEDKPIELYQTVIISAWDANIPIKDEWLQQKFGFGFNGDCRLDILNHLIKTYNHLR